ncbi:hypothetical protein AKJ37_04250 [candidate division MSBL1 archaeon SCGC-AAA259I09]|uniref:Uncharacterized protein n=1 Tax=candidate division MSBL1 archaeon SCGC-AAA259I09 TaxID=1698267 RepID=A0A133URG5_9EURY|nr:hypothetical protein AKJ37_04250 [candidate division MSBL1 archaeon SCGC-AAA259I09]
MMNHLPAPLNDKNKLIMYLKMYEPKTNKRGSDSRKDTAELENIPILESPNFEIKSKFLEEIEALKKLCGEGLLVERAITLLRYFKGPLLFDRLSIESQELFILFMEKEWENSNRD